MSTGRHYQRATLSGTVAPGGTGKTTLDQTEAVALATARNLLGEQPEQRSRVWLHNGEDSTEELDRRIVAICKHYDIPQEALADWLILTSGAEMPLKVASGFSDLKIDTLLVDEMTRFILDNAIDVVMFDPLVTLHSVNENDNGKMDAVCRIFTQVANVCDCAIEISHHTRKLPSGASFDRVADDTRGASAVRDAVRMMRVLNLMSLEDAQSLGMDEFERLAYFRVDRGKANYVPPAATAVWRKFENVALANGDNVGVVTPWQHPGQGQDSPEKSAAEKKVENLFLALLVRFAQQGRYVNHSSGPNYAPHVFAKEPEAKDQKIGKAALADAMRRLFNANRIRVDDDNRGGHPRRSIVVV